jgi:hypothetical protein
MAIEWGRFGGATGRALGRGLDAAQRMMMAQNMRNHQKEMYEKGQADLAKREKDKWARADYYKDEEIAREKERFEISEKRWQDKFQFDTMKWEAEQKALEEHRKVQKRYWDRGSINDVRQRAELYYKMNYLERIDEIEENQQLKMRGDKYGTMTTKDRTDIIMMEDEKKKLRKEGAKFLSPKLGFETPEWAGEKEDLDFGITEEKRYKNLKRLNLLMGPSVNEMMGTTDKKTIIRTGKEKGTGRKVVEYSDGTRGYAD